MSTREEARLADALQDIRAGAIAADFFMRGSGWDDAMKAAVAKLRALEGMESQGEPVGYASRTQLMMMATGMVGTCPIHKSPLSTPESVPLFAHPVEKEEG